MSTSVLDENQKSELQDLLYEYQDIFMTRGENPAIGRTNLVKHRIVLKPDAKPKHQRPYRLPPDKRKVLRDQLDELLRQGIIAPVTEDEEIPITIPIVLVTKRANQDTEPGTKEHSLTHYRFCCEMRYLNTQMQDFSYQIPDLQE